MVHGRSFSTGSERGTHTKKALPIEGGAFLNILATSYFPTVRYVSIFRAKELNDRSDGVATLITAAHPSEAGRELIHRPLQQWPAIPPPLLWLVSPALQDTGTSKRIP